MAEHGQTTTIAAVALPKQVAHNLSRVATRAEKARQQRNDLIVEAVTEHGGGLREVARLTGLTHAGIAHIVAETTKRWPDDYDPETA